MKDFEPKHTISKLTSVKRKTVSISQEKLIETQYLDFNNPLPLVVKPAVDGVNLVTWAANNRDFIESNLLQHGGILFRNFNFNGVSEFETFIKVISGELLEYSYRSTPRSQVNGKIYTSTEYPPTHYIPVHNEMAYSLNWPMKIWFYCLKSAEQGGETPIVDSRKIFARLAPKIKEKFIEKKVMYVRNYDDKIDLKWENVFQTTEKSEVEKYCRNAGIEFEWKEGNRLRTRQVCQAIATHPKTGDKVWFNQAHLFHISSLESEVRQSLLSTFKEEDLPRNAYYGDGSAIETSVLDEIRALYQQESVIFPWQ